MDEPTCSEDGCGKPTQTDGRCSACYNREYRKRKKAGTLIPHAVPNPGSRCSIPGDDHSPGDDLKNGMCGRHYQRQRRNGDPLVKRNSWDGVTPEDRLLAKTDKNGPLPEKRPELGPCWVWTGAKQGSGYGTFYLEGCHVGAHVAAYTLMRKPVPEGAELDHLCHPGDGSCPHATCRHRLCVNPDHLDPVTRLENQKRGNTWAARQLAVTHCPKGHEYTPENTRVRIAPSGNEMRSCRACQRKTAPGVPVVPNNEKTHCPKGHPYDEENTYWTPKGGRQCRICKREAYLAWQKRQKVDGG
jgi:hypothetical protein